MPLVLNGTPPARLLQGPEVGRLTQPLEDSRATPLGGRRCNARPVLLLIELIPKAEPAACQAVAAHRLTSRGAAVQTAAWPQEGRLSYRATVASYVLLLNTLCKTAGKQRCQKLGTAGSQANARLAAELSQNGLRRCGTGSGTPLLLAAASRKALAHCGSARRTVVGRKGLQQSCAPSTQHELRLAACTLRPGLQRRLVYTPRCLHTLSYDDSTTTCLQVVHTRRPGLTKKHMLCKLHLAQVNRLVLKQVLGKGISSPTSGRSCRWTSGAPRGLAAEELALGTVGSF